VSTEIFTRFEKARLYAQTEAAKLQHREQTAGKYFSISE
jgi:hypothetical protein